MENTLEKYFKGEKALYFNSTDALTTLIGETWLTYTKLDKDKVLINFHSTDQDECAIKICTNENDLENLIKALIY
jgi:hypothetical protein